MKFLKITLLALSALLGCFGALAAPSLGAERVTFCASDAFPLVGLYEKVDGGASSSPVVLLLHMFKGQKESWQPLMDELKEQGVSSLAIDLRGHGESRFNGVGVDQSSRVTNRDQAFFNQMHQDGIAALAWLRNQGHQKIGVVGASVGCSIAMHMVAVASPEIAAMVLMTPGRDYLGIDTVSHLAKWTGMPLLILTSEEEAERGAMTLYDRLQGPDTKLVVFEQVDIHGTMMFGEVDGVEERISNWLVSKLSTKKEQRLFTVR